MFNPDETYAKVVLGYAIFAVPLEDAVVLLRAMRGAISLDSEYKDGHTQFYIRKNDHEMQLSLITDEQIAKIKLYTEHKEQ